MIWNTEQYTQRLGIVAVMIPVNTVKESMNNVMHMQSMYLLDGQGTVLVSGGNEQAQNLQMPKVAGNGPETHETNGAWMVRSGLLQEGGMTLVSLVPRDVLVQESGENHPGNADLLWNHLCTYCTAQLGSRQFLGRVRRLDTTMEAVDRDCWSPLMCRSADELGRLILRYNGMVEQIQRLMEEQYILGKEKSEAQLHALQAQISPHFLYNTLDMMNWMAVKGKTGGVI